VRRRSIGFFIPLNYAAAFGPKGHLLGTGKRLRSTGKICGDH
jgi:hypothetical protein